MDAKQIDYGLQSHTNCHLTQCDMATYGFLKISTETHRSVKPHLFLPGEHISGSLPCCNA